MKTTEIVVMAIFGLLVLAGLAAALWQGSKEKARLAEYAAKHGWSLVDRGDARLAALLDEVAPTENWTPLHVIQVESGPRNAYLFSFQMSPKSSNSRSSWNGFASLSARTGNLPEAPVAIITRTPGLDKMLGNRREAGTDEFRRQFTVTCPQAGAAEAVINAAVERCLLDHASGREWNLAVAISRTAVLVRSRWADTEQEWDYLASLGTRLRDAVR